MKTYTSDWMVADEDSPLEINLDNGARIKVWAKPAGVAQCELKAEVNEPVQPEHAQTDSK